MGGAERTRKAVDIHDNSLPPKPVSGLGSLRCGYSKTERRYTIARNDKERQIGGSSNWNGSLGRFRGYIAKRMAQMASLLLQTRKLTSPQDSAVTTSPRRRIH